MAERLVTFHTRRRRFNSDLPMTLAADQQIVGVQPFDEDGDRGLDVFIATFHIDGQERP